MFANAYSGSDGPTPNPETQHFWNESRIGRFVLPRCKACGKAHWYPRAFCPFCHSDIDWVDASGRGTIYSYTVTGKEDDRYCLAYVELDEGPRVLTNILVKDASALKVGASVEVVMHACPNDNVIPVFRLLSEILDAD
jgi:uncharacterized OB-fold protein